jgi:hypothetical protein
VMMMMPLICAKVIQNCSGKKNYRRIFDSGAFSSRCVCDGKKKADQGMRGWCRRWVKRKRKKRRTDVESAQHWPQIVQLSTVVAMCSAFHALITGHLFPISAHFANCSSGSFLAFRLKGR